MEDLAISRRNFLKFIASILISIFLPGDDRQLIKNLEGLLAPLPKKVFDRFELHSGHFERGVFEGIPYAEYLKAYNQMIPLKAKVLKSILRLMHDNKIKEDFGSLLKRHVKYIAITDSLRAGAGGKVIEKEGIILLSSQAIEQYDGESKRTFDFFIAYALIHEILHLAHPEWSETEVYDMNFRILAPIQSFDQLRYNTMRYLIDLAKSRDNDNLVIYFLDGYVPIDFIRNELNPLKQASELPRKRLSI